MEKAKQTVDEMAMLTTQSDETEAPSPPRPRPRSCYDIPNYDKLCEASREEYKLLYEIAKKRVDELSIICQNYGAPSPTPTPTTSNLLPETPVPADSNTHECKVGCTCIETGLKVSTVGKDSNPRPKARL